MSRTGSKSRRKLVPNAELMTGEHDQLHIKTAIYKPGQEQLSQIGPNHNYMKIYYLNGKKLKTLRFF